MCKNRTLGHWDGCDVVLITLVHVLCLLWSPSCSALNFHFFPYTFEGGGGFDGSPSSTLAHYSFVLSDETVLTSVSILHSCTPPFSLCFFFFSFLPGHKHARRVFATSMLVSRRRNVSRRQSSRCHRRCGRCAIDASIGLLLLLLLLLWLLLMVVLLQEQGWLLWELRLDLTTIDLGNMARVAIVHTCNTITAATAIETGDRL